MLSKDKLSKEEIIHIATLSNLKISETELEKYAAQLQETINYIKNLDEIPTERVAATSHSTNLKNVFFEDGLPNERQLTADEAVSNSANLKNSLFKVVKIM